MSLRVDAHLFAGTGSTIDTKPRFSIYLDCKDLADPVLLAYRRLHDTFAHPVEFCGNLAVSLLRHYRAGDHLVAIDSHQKNRVRSSHIRLELKGIGGNSRTVDGHLIVVAL